MENNLSLWHLNKEKDRIESVVVTKLDASKSAVEALNINAKTVNNCTVETNVPQNALFMTQDERTKLSSVQAGAQVNNPNFNKIRISDQLIVADNANSTLTFTNGDGIILTPNSNSDTINISAYNLYEHPDTHSIQMITGAAQVAKTGDYNDLLNKPTNMTANGGNSDTVGGKLPTDFIQKLPSISLEIVNNSNYKISYMGDISPAIANQIGLLNDWYHIIYIPHTNNNGYGCQIVSRFSTSELLIRSSTTTTWEKWVKYSIDGHTHSYNELTNVPNIDINGGDAASLTGKTVNDNGTSNQFLWTASKIITELNKKANSVHEHNYIPTSATCNKNWNWSGQGGQPTWLWGGNDPSNMYVYNPSNFNVSSSNTSKHLIMPQENYGSAIEIGSYIDFHKINSSSDYDGRLQINSDNTLQYSGNFKASKVYNAVFNDLAEWFKKGDNNLEPGDIVSYNEETFAKKCNLDNVSCTVGVYSDTYGSCLGGDNLENMEDNHINYVPIGISGRVRVKVKGDINPGEFITCSDVPGVGIKGEFIPGRIVGKALEKHTGDNISRIWILIMNL